MKKCVCGKYVKDKETKCPYCGSNRFQSIMEQQYACPNCGENNPSHCSNCLNCGKPL